MTDKNQTSDKPKSLYDDSWHPPHADHAGEVPTVETDVGPYGLSVTLDQWGPAEKCLATVYNQAVSNWGESPHRVRYDDDLTPDQLKVVESILDGKHLSNALEAITFSFTIVGCTRACTHELVRTRVGASFAQHGGRDNDWRHRRWTIPETLSRMLIDGDDTARLEDAFFSHLTEMGFDVSTLDVEKITGSIPGVTNGQALLHFMLGLQKAFYAASVDAGIPWQDARRILGIGHQTYIHANYNYLALKGVTAHRLEHGAVDWEIDCVAQLMVREVWLRCPRILAKRLRSHSDTAGVNRFATLYSWPPNGKHPVPKDYDQSKRTQFRREQMPFWILNPMCLIDRECPVSWIPTDGTFPHEQYAEYIKIANTRATQLDKELI